MSWTSPRANKIAKAAGRASPAPTPQKRVKPPHSKAQPGMAVPRRKDDRGVPEVLIYYSGIAIMGSSYVNRAKAPRNSRSKRRESSGDLTGDRTGATLPVPRGERAHGSDRRNIGEVGARSKDASLWAFL